MIIRRLCRLFAVMVAVALCAGGLYAASLMEEKLNLERSIQERAERLVEKIIGSRDMVVFVNVDLEPESTRVTPRKSDFLGMQMTEEEYLPGITYTQVPSGSATTSTKGVTIKRVGILVTLDQSVKDSTVNEIKKQVHELLGLDPVRNDAVTVRKIAFAKPVQTWERHIDRVLGHAYWLAIILLVAFFIFGPLRIFFKNFNHMTQLKIDADASLSSHGANRGGDTGILSAILDLKNMMSTGRRQSGDMAGEKGKHFGFITGDNLVNLQALVKNESPETIAVIINYLPPEYAAKLITSLNQQQLSGIAAQLASEKILDAAEVGRIEKDVREKIDYLAGGKGYFMNMLDHTDPDTQELILANLQRHNPALSAQLRSSLFFFEDIVHLQKTIIQKVVRTAQRQEISLAVVLKSAPEEIKTKIMDAMTEGAKALLTEEISLTGELPEARIRDEQLKLVLMIRSMVRSNEIPLNTTLH